MTVRKIAVIGGGTMGSGIAQVAAQSGYEVILEDIDGEYARAALARIRERLEKRGEGFYEYK
jgi:3-hydroxybutyryl-CoA dehydrogenase